MEKKINKQYVKNNKLQSLLLDDISIYPEGTIRVSYGNMVSPVLLKRSGIDIVSIAKSLSKTPRFRGTGNKFYSVARHSIDVCNSIPYNGSGSIKYAKSLMAKMYGLLHDAAESYVSDIPSPLKKLSQFKEICKVEDTIERKILQKYILPAMAIMVYQSDITSAGALPSSEDDFESFFSHEIKGMKDVVKEEDRRALTREWNSIIIDDNSFCSDHKQDESDFINLYMSLDKKIKDILLIIINQSGDAVTAEDISDYYKELSDRLDKLEFYQK